MRKILFVLLWLLSLSPAEAAYLDLAWDPNQEPDLAGYRVYYGISSGEYINSVDVRNTTTYRLDNLLEDITFYVAVTAYDLAGRESDFSEEVSGIGIIDEEGVSLEAGAADADVVANEVVVDPSELGTSPAVAGGGDGGCFIRTVGRFESFVLHLRRKP